MNSILRCRAAIVILAAGLCWTDSRADAQTAKIYELSGIQGYSQPFRTSEVSADQSGLLRALEVEAGDEVGSGQPLAQLDNTVALARLEQALLASQATGELAVAECQLASRKDRLARINGLHSRGHATASELRQAEVDLQTAEASLLRAQEVKTQAVAEHQKLEHELERYVVRAPFAGAVLELKKEVGEYVGPSNPVICLIAELDRLSVDFMVSRHARERITDGQLLPINFLEMDKQAVGRVYFISPFPHGETGTFTVRLEVENKSRQFMAGERCLLMLDELQSTRSAFHDNPTEKSASDLSAGAG